jgi:long-chain acyl-CoA synthetase
MKGYWPTPGSGLVDGWLPTGDLCRMDEDGYFFLVDRNKDMINVSGNKVYSTSVDEVLFEHPAVAAAVTIGVPDPERPGSERVKAFVVLRNSHSATVEEILAHCREKLAPYAVPKAIEFREALPMTVTQKLFKKQLRDEELAKMNLRPNDGGSEPHSAGS